MYKHQIVFKEERVFGGFCELRVLLKIFKLFVYGSVGGVWPRWPRKANDSFGLQLFE